MQTSIIIINTKRLRRMNDEKVFATLLCLALVAGLFAACSGSKDNNAKADSKKVGIAVLSENGSLYRYAYRDRV